MMIARIGGYIKPNMILPIHSFAGRRKHNLDYQKANETLQKLKNSLALAEQDLLHWKISTSYGMNPFSNLKEERDANTEAARKVKQAENLVKQLREAISKYEDVTAQNMNEIDERW